MKKFLLVLLGVFLLLTALSALVAVLMKDGISMGEKIALVRIEGPILDSRTAVEDLKKYADDPSIKAIVLRVDSPGGPVAPAQEIFEQVKKAVAKKKVVASMGSVAASGGYYVLAPASVIVANPGTITGSIGVIMEIPNIRGLMDKVGVKTEVIKSGSHKDLASIFRDLQEDERKILQGLLDDVHEQFISAVAVEREMPVEKVRALADGRVYSGRQALEVGLVDELGSLQDAIGICAKLAGIEGEPEVVSRKEKRTLIEMLRGEVSTELGGMFPTISLKYMLSP